MYHGSHNEIMGTHAAHVGLCITDSLSSAQTYAGRWGVVYAVELDLDALDVVEVEGYDHDSDEAPGDSGEYPDADVIVYEDEDERGQSHTTWRLVSARAVAACTLTVERYMDSDACPCSGGCELCHPMA